MCIMSGCDYLDRLPQCGLKTVHKQFRKFSNVDRGIKSFLANYNMKKVGGIDSKTYYQSFLKVGDIANQIVPLVFYTVNNRTVLGTLI